MYNILKYLFGERHPVPDPEKGENKLVSSNDQGVPPLCISIDIWSSIKPPSISVISSRRTVPTWLSTCCGDYDIDVGEQIGEQNYEPIQYLLDELEDVKFPSKDLRHSRAAYLGVETSDYRSVTVHSRIVTFVPPWASVLASNQHSVDAYPDVERLCLDRRVHPHQIAEVTLNNGIDYWVVYDDPMAIEPSYQVIIGFSSDPYYLV